MNHPFPGTVCTKLAFASLGASGPKLRSTEPYVESLSTRRNIGRALAEFSNAERFGFRAGPREFEQQGDGYLLRAEQEIRQAQAAGSTRADSVKSLSLAQNDLERARNLYEPLDGYSNISANLNRLYNDRTKLQALQEKFKQAAPPKRYSRRARWR